MRSAVALVVISPDVALPGCAWSCISVAQPAIPGAIVPEVNESGSTRPPVRALVVALGAFVMLGLVDGALGVAWPSLRHVFERELSDLGMLLAFGSLGYLVASIGYGRLHARLGTGVLLGVGSALLATGVTGIALAPAWMVVAGGTVMVGLGGGLVDTGMNAHAALSFDVGSINLLHACYGVGATLGPVVVTLSLVSTGMWRAGYGAMAVVQVVSMVTIWVRRRRWAGAEPDLSGDPDVSHVRLQSFLLLVMFFLYTGVEVATGQWAFTLLSEGRDMGTAAAGTWVALYWGGLTVGRFGFGLFGDRLAPSRTLNGSMVVSVLGLTLLWIDPLGLGAIGLPVAGLGFASVFPTLVSLTPGRIGRVASTRTMGYQLAAANIGAAGLPWVIGLLAGARGLSFLAPGLLMSGAALAVVHYMSGRPSGGRRR